MELRPSQTVKPGLWVLYTKRTAQRRVSHNYTGYGVCIGLVKVGSLAKGRGPQRYATGQPICTTSNVGRGGRSVAQCDQTNLNHTTSMQSATANAVVRRSCTLMRLDLGFFNEPRYSSGICPDSSSNGLCIELAMSFSARADNGILSKIRGWHRVLACSGAHISIAPCLSLLDVELRMP